MNDNKDFNHEKIDGRDVQLKKANGFFKWIDNFWYYHKWKVIVVSFFAIVIIVGTVQMLNKKEHDVNVTVATHTVFYSENVQGIESALTHLMHTDRNGDGIKSVQLHTYKIYSEEEMGIANSTETDGEGNPIVYADPSFNRSQMQEYNSYLITGECTVMILSEYLYSELINRRAEDILLKPMSEIFGSEIPEGTMADGYGVRLKDTEAYDYFEAFKTLPDDTVICIMRPLVTKTNEEAYQFAVDYFKNIVTFGE